MIKNISYEKYTTTITMLNNIIKAQPITITKPTVKHVECLKALVKDKMEKPTKSIIPPFIKRLFAHCCHNVKQVHLGFHLMNTHDLKRANMAGWGSGFFTELFLLNTNWKVPDIDKQLPIQNWTRKPTIPNIRFIVSLFENLEVFTISATHYNTETKTYKYAPTFELCPIFCNNLNAVMEILEQRQTSSLSKFQYFAFMGPGTHDWYYVPGQRDAHPTSRLQPVQQWINGQWYYPWGLWARREGWMATSEVPRQIAIFHRRNATELPDRILCITRVTGAKFRF